MLTSQTIGEYIFSWKSHNTSAALKCRGPTVPVQPARGLQLDVPYVVAALLPSKTLLIQTEKKCVVRLVL